MQPEPASPTERSSPQGRGRLLAFAAFCLVTVSAAAGYVTLAARRSGAAKAVAAPAVSASLGSGSNGAASPPARPQPTLAELRAEPHVYLRSTRDGEHGRIAVASLAHPDERRRLLELGCE